MAYVRSTIGPEVPAPLKCWFETSMLQKKPTLLQNKPNLRKVQAQTYIHLALVDPRRRPYRSLFGGNNERGYPLPSANRPDSLPGILSLFWATEASDPTLYRVRRCMEGFQKLRAETSELSMPADPFRVEGKKSISLVLRVSLVVLFSPSSSRVLFGCQLPQISMPPHQTVDTLHRFPSAWI